jgi:hypothetical protein
MAAGATVNKEQLRLDIRKTIAVLAGLAGPAAKEERELAVGINASRWLDEILEQWSFGPLAALRVTTLRTPVRLYAFSVLSVFSVLSALIEMQLMLGRPIDDDDDHHPHQKRP